MNDFFFKFSQHFYLTCDTDIQKDNPQMING